VLVRGVGLKNGRMTVAELCPKDLYFSVFGVEYMSVAVIGPTVAVDEMCDLTTEQRAVRSDYRTARCAIGSLNSWLCDRTTGELDVCVCVCVWRCVRCDIMRDVVWGCQRDCVGVLMTLLSR
jgi:hypothetical protein